MQIARPVNISEQRTTSMALRTPGGDAEPPRGGNRRAAAPTKRRANGRADQRAAPHNVDSPKPKRISTSAAAPASPMFTLIFRALDQCDQCGGHLEPGERMAGVCSSCSRSLLPGQPRTTKTRRSAK